MDDQFRQEVLEVVAALAKSQQEKLAAAGTFVDIEELTAEVGDEVARQLANWELSRRSEALCEHPRHACPDCGKQCSIAPDLEPSILQGLRGEIEYAEPRCYCPRCRRNFFPSGRPGQPSVSARTTTARDYNTENP